ncbi:Neurochondrin-domain-containing protein [Coniochaeta sp. 2T2.1]|nr:Neurochondrin-domain-containing protein [Coniochaeta sp. 2T2.1]
MAEASKQAEEHAWDGAPSLQKIQDLLKSKDDTARFVGLAILKSALDNSPELRQDEDAVTALWVSISPKFLDRLLRTGSGKKTQPQKEAKEMLDLAVSVIHTFAVLLPDNEKAGSKFYARIPRLVSCLTYTSGDTEELLLQTLLTLVSQLGGASALIGLDDLSPLIEIAPSRPIVLDIFSHACAWLQERSTNPDEKPKLQAKVDKIIQGLVLSFKGTDGVTLLAFLSDFLRRLDPEIIPQTPTWLPQVILFIRNLVTSRPTQAGREAYTNLAATLLQVYPLQAPTLLFSDSSPTTSSSSSNPFSYLLLSLLLVDLRSSFPTLLEQLNSPSYAPLSTRLTSAFDILSHFISHLVRALDSPSPTSSSSLSLSPSNLLSLRKSISETISNTLSYLRDRYDASVAGAMGLHPSARTAPTHAGGDRQTLAWDSATDRIERDGLILSAVRALALWLREDDNDQLRREAAGLSDLFVDLYSSSCQPNNNNNNAAGLDFRQPVLVALQGICAVEEGVDALLEQDGFKVLSSDMISILYSTSNHSTVSEDDASRGIEIVRLLLPIAEQETAGVREEWMDVVTRVAGWDVPDTKQGGVVEEFQVAIVQLVTALLTNNHPGVVRRYRHSVDAIRGVVRQLRDRRQGDGELREELGDVLSVLGGLGV